MATAASHGQPPQPPQQAVARLDKWQAWATIIAAVAAALAAAFSGYGLVLQREATLAQTAAVEDQVRSSDEIRAERKTEYADQVSWWYAAGDGLIVQNRSPVPITNVVLRYKHAVVDQPELDNVVIDWVSVAVHDGYPTVSLDIIPPCTLAHVSMDEVRQFIVIPSDDPLHYEEVQLAFVEFSDVHGSWKVDLGQAASEVAEDEKVFPGHGDLYLRLVGEPASDCGLG
jgi:hypothetical protein